RNCPTDAGMAFIGANQAAYSTCNATGLCSGNLRASKPLMVRGVGCTGVNANASTAACPITVDGTFRGNRAWLSLAGVTTMTFRNLMAYYPPTLVRIRESSSLLFDNVQGGAGNGFGGEGPAGYDIGTNCFFIKISAGDISGNPSEEFAVKSAIRKNNVVTFHTGYPNRFKVGDHASVYGLPDFNGTFTVASVTGPDTFTASQFGLDIPSETGGWIYSDRYAAILIDPGTGQGSGLIYIEDEMINNGMIK